MQDRLFKHLRRHVEIRCQGILYRGVFMGADEEWIYLQAETTWLTLPLLEVTSFKPTDAPEKDRLYRPVPGEAPPDAEEREKKRRHRKLKLAPPPDPDEKPED